MRLFLWLVLAAVLAFGQTAYFPGAILTDAYAGKLKDRSASDLTADISNSTLTVPVVDGTKFIGYQFVTIDDEQMMVCSVAGNNLTICTGTRGFDWTTPAAHSSGAEVRGQMTSWLPNSLREDLKAVETALGVNLANVALASHNQAASTITSGTLGLARGGTNASSFTAARCVRSNAGGTALESAAADCGTGGGGAATEYKYYVAAICQNTVAGAGFSTPTSGAPTPACGGDETDPTHGVLQFITDSGTQTVYGSFRYPSGLTSIDLYIRWRAPVAVTGNVVWQNKTGCTGSNERIQDLSWNAAQTVTSTASGTALGEVQATISTLTLTGCAAGERLNFSFLRDPTHSSDTLAAGTIAELLELVFAITR